MVIFDLCQFAKQNSGPLLKDFSSDKSRKKKSIVRTNRLQHELSQKKADAEASTCAHYNLCSRQNYSHTIAKTWQDLVQTEWQVTEIAGENPPRTTSLTE